MSTPRSLLAAAILVGATFSSSAGEPQSATFRSGIDLVHLGVTVSDRQGAPIANLSADDFELFEDGRQQSIRYFSSAGGPAPELHLGVLLDVSESMQTDLAFTRTASIKFLNTLTDAVDITVVDFDTQVRVARYGQSEFPRLVERIRNQRARGDTALFDAIGMYLDGAATQEGRKIMLLYTDGGDTTSALRLGELIELLKASDVTIYVVGVWQGRGMAARNGQQMVLRQIADTTGGQMFLSPSVKELDDLYARVAAEIRAQYTLGYVSTNARTDGTWRKVEVKLKRPISDTLKVRNRKGYYALYRPAVGERHE